MRFPMPSMRPRAMVGPRPQAPAGKGSINTARAEPEQLAGAQANAVALAVQEIVATGACARTQTLSDARVAVAGYLASFGRPVAAILAGGEDTSSLPSNPWFAAIGPRQVGSISTARSIRAVALLLPQALLTACQSIPVARTVPGTSTVPGAPVARTAPGDTVQGAPVARTAPTESPIAQPVPRTVSRDATPQQRTVQPRDLPRGPGLPTDRRTITSSDTDLRANAGPDTLSVALEALVGRFPTACQSVRSIEDARRVVNSYRATMPDDVKRVLDGENVPVVTQTSWIGRLAGPDQAQSIRSVFYNLPGALLVRCTGSGTAVGVAQARDGGPVTVVGGPMTLEPLKARTLSEAATAAMAAVGTSVCSDIAFLGADARTRAAQGAQATWRRTWTQQMERVLAGVPWPASADGPGWYVRMMASAGGNVATARAVLTYVIAQMADRIVGGCAEIRRQSERE